MKNMGIGNSNPNEAKSRCTIGLSRPRRYFAENASPLLRLYQSSREKSGMKRGGMGPASLKFSMEGSDNALLHFSAARRLSGFMIGRARIGASSFNAFVLFADSASACR